MESDVHALVCANGEWIRDESWRLDCNGLEESQDFFAIVCNGGHHIGGGLLRLTWFRQLLILCLHCDEAVFVVVLVCLAGVLPFLFPLRDGVSKNLQKLACVRLPVKDRGLCEKWREEDDVAWSPVPLII